MEKISKDLKMEQFYQSCAEHGLKITPQRTLIYQELIHSKDHPSIDTLYQKIRKSLPNISFDTVYRTVLSFAELGLVIMIEGYGGSKRFDGNVTQHHHFRCLKCLKIIDFDSEYYDNINIPEDIKKQFAVVNAKVVLEGICEDCQSEK